VAFSSVRRLTPPSSGHATAGFAHCVMPLMSNVRPRMNRLFVIALAISALAFLAHAAFAPVYEQGAFTYIAPLFFVAIAFVFAAAIWRARWSWRWVFAWSWVHVLITLAFPPMPVHFGQLTFAARVLAGIEVLSCIVVFVCMRSSTVKEWFRNGSIA